MTLRLPEHNSENDKTGKLPISNGESVRKLHVGQQVQYIGDTIFVILKLKIEKSRDKIFSRQVLESLEGHLRAILATLTVEEVYM